MRKFKIVSDSSSDVFSLCNVDFDCAAMKIITAEKEYTDDIGLDTEKMAKELQSYKGRSSTSCPNVDDWLKAFDGADDVLCVTITSALSGSYNTACMAKELYEEAAEGRRVFVLDSRSTGPEMALIIEKAAQLVTEGVEFERICLEIQRYSKKTGLLFMLQSMKNLANNGRINHLTATVAGVLGIRALGRASEAGELEMLDKCRGESKTFEAIISRLREYGFTDGRLKIGHCCCEQTGQKLKELIQKEFSKARVELYRCRGLCTFYAETGGLLIGFEGA